MCGDGSARVVRHPGWKSPAEGSAEGAPDGGDGARCPEEDTEPEGQRVVLRQAGGEPFFSFGVVLEIHCKGLVLLCC